jgi:hypothetical protein
VLLLLAWCVRGPLESIDALLLLLLHCIAAIICMCCADVHFASSSSSWRCCLHRMTACVRAAAMSMFMQLAAQVFMFMCLVHGHWQAVEHGCTQVPVAKAAQVLRTGEGGIVRDGGEAGRGRHRF